VKCYVRYSGQDGRSVAYGTVDRMGEVLRTVQWTGWVKCCLRYSGRDGLTRVDLFISTATLDMCTYVRRLECMLTRFSSA